MSIVMVVNTIWAIAVIFIIASISASLIKIAKNTETQIKLMREQQEQMLEVILQTAESLKTYFNDKDVRYSIREIDLHLMEIKEIYAKTLDAINGIDVNTYTMHSLDSLGRIEDILTNIDRTLSYRFDPSIED